MRVLIQRVTRASVSVEGRVVGAIDRGLVLLVGIGPGDGEGVAQAMAAKVAGLRVFSDEQGKFNLSLLDVGGGALVVSQFTLYADASRGRRPSFAGAGSPELARGLVEGFAEGLRGQGVGRVETGRFGASMAVEIHNEGPVTIWLDSEALGM